MNKMQIKQFGVRSIYRMQQHYGSKSHYVKQLQNRIYDNNCHNKLILLQILHLCLTHLNTYLNYGNAVLTSIHNGYIKGINVSVFQVRGSHTFILTYDLLLVIIYKTLVTSNSFSCKWTRDKRTFVF